MILSSLTQEAEKICSKVKNGFVLGDYFIHNNPWANRPWEEFNYWNGWYALAKLKQPRQVLEIGTGFGYSTIALARGAENSLILLVSLDLGTFGKECKWKDNLPYVKKGIEKFEGDNNLRFLYRQFDLDTQDFFLHPSKWQYRFLEDYLMQFRFDLILLDGKHEGDGLYNDLNCFLKFGRKNCLIICDDLQYSDAAKSFARFIKKNDKNILEHYIWKFLTCNAAYAGSFQRNQGLIIKK